MSPKLGKRIMVGRMNNKKKKPRCRQSREGVEMSTRRRVRRERESKKRAQEWSSKRGSQPTYTHRTSRSTRYDGPAANWPWRKP